MLENIIFVCMYILSFEIVWYHLDPSVTKKEGSNLQSRPSDPWRYNSTKLWSDILHIHRSTPQRSWSIYCTPDPTNSQVWTHHKTQAFESPDFLLCWHTHASQPEDKSIQHLQSNYTREHKLSMDLKSQSFTAPIKISHCLSLLKFIYSSESTWSTRRNGKGKATSLIAQLQVLLQLSAPPKFLHSPSLHQKREFYLSMSTTLFF